MKTLYVVRHAKSSWDDAGKDDFDRPLNERGKRDAPRMGKRLKEKDIIPHLMLSSPAKRAISTCKRICEVLKYPEEKIKTDRELYHANEEEILEVVRQTDDKYSSLMIFGHNPGLTDFVNAMMDDEAHAIDNLPTCAVVSFKINTDSWRKIQMGEAKFVFFDYPKSKED